MDRPAYAPCHSDTSESLQIHKATILDKGIGSRGKGANIPYMCSKFVHVLWTAYKSDSSGFASVRRILRIPAFNKTDGRIPC
jgi:hypothetical protein